MSILNSFFRLGKKNRIDNVVRKKIKINLKKVKNLFIDEGTIKLYKNTKRKRKIIGKILSQKYHLAISLLITY